MFYNIKNQFARYAQISEQFGCSSGQAKDAIAFLEHMGVVRREFRTLRSNGMVYANVLYLALDVERLKALTYPCGEISPDGCPEKSGGASDEISDTPVSEFRGGVPKFPQTPMGNFPRQIQRLLQRLLQRFLSIHLRAAKMRQTD